MNCECCCNCLYRHKCELNKNWSDKDKHTKRCPIYEEDIKCCKKK